ncbi:MAG: hypothetical protein K0R57_5359 [Paenibacillaceae bacterium]|jgi:two-component system response regulator YesN|nr:hypothetical protein [Paenibacillaceae bacterium]
MSPYKVLLVEDEIPARTVFRQMIEEQSERLALVGEAEDGRDGLELYLKHRPELIVTDITMPGMNGLEMLREIAEAGEPQPQIVILTCHQDFHYAQQAIHLNAASYLIKDDCLSDPGLLGRTLVELSDKVVSLHQSRKKQQQLEQRVRSNEMEIEQGLFLDMLRNQDLEEAWLRSLEEPLPVAGGEFKALLLELDRSSLRFPLDQLEELKLWQFAGVNVLKELLSGCGAHKVVALDKGRFFAIYAPASDKDNPALLDQILDSFRTYLKMNCMGLQFTFERGIARQLPDLKKLVSMAHPLFYHWNESMPGIQWEELSRFGHIPEPRGRFWLKVLKQSMLDPHLAPVSMEEERNAFYQQAKEQHWDPEQIKSLYLRVFLDLNHFKMDAEGGADLEAAFRKSLEQCQTFFSVHDTTLTYFRKLQQLYGDAKKMDVSLSRLIRRMHEEVGYPYKLEELAASINYSVPYFSSMFKKATGKSFIQYLTDLRIEKAKLLLLTTDQKTFEIAEAIGLENYRSFNRVFKKETGLTPSDFRRKWEG